MALALGAATAAAQTATPEPRATGPSASPTVAGGATATRAVVATPMRAPLAVATSPAPSTARSPAAPRPTVIPIAEAVPEPLPQAGTVGITAPPAAAPRAFRTPERAGEPAFLAPRAAAPAEPAAGADAGRMGMPAPAPMRPPARGGTRTVVFHAVARTAVYGVDLFVT